MAARNETNRDVCFVWTVTTTATTGGELRNKTRCGFCCTHWHHHPKGRDLVLIDTIQPQGRDRKLSSVSFQTLQISLYKRYFTSTSHGLSLRNSTNTHILSHPSPCMWHIRHHVCDITYRDVTHMVTSHTRNESHTHCDVTYIVMSYIHIVTSHIYNVTSHKLWRHTHIVMSHTHTHT